MEGPRRLHYGWVVVGVGFLSAFVIYGARFSIGLFLPPLRQLEGWSIASLATVLSLANLLAGLVQPGIGNLADRFGAPRLLAAGMAAQALGLFLSGMATQLWHLYLTLGLLLGVGSAATSVVVTAALVSRWFVARRTTALGLVNAGLNLGQILVVSGTGLALAAYGWRPAFYGLGLLIAAFVPLVLVFAKPGPEALGLAPYGHAGQGGSPRPGGDAVPVGQTWADGSEGPAGAAAGGHPAGASDPVPLEVPVYSTVTFRRLLTSLFCCGFLMSMIFTHYPNLAQSLGATPGQATAMLAMMGGTGGLGGIVAGLLADRFGGRRVLSGVYALRAVITTALLLRPTPAVLFAYPLVFGLFGSGTIPLTSGLTADFFGAARVGRVFGWVFLSHQVGVALGATLAGWSFDHLGTYAPALAAAAAVSLAGAVISWTLGEPRPVPPSMGTPAVATTGGD